LDEARQELKILKSRCDRNLTADDFIEARDRALKRMRANENSNHARAIDAFIRELSEPNFPEEKEIPPNKCCKCGYIGEAFISRGFDRGKRRWECPNCGAKSYKHERIKS
jgi:DNA-directed RNA polymerase subunit M/transcription elongation factor TFIIS